jgi:hypothetical protein
MTTNTMLIELNFNLLHLLCKLKLLLEIVEQRPGIEASVETRWIPLSRK